MTVYFTSEMYCIVNVMVEFTGCGTDGRKKDPDIRTRARNALSHTHTHTHARTRWKADAAPVRNDRIALGSIEDRPHYITVNTKHG